jgi:hypothetical protein
MSNRDANVIRLWVEPATTQANNDLYPLVALGDDAAREKMIQSNIGLVMHCVDQFIGLYPTMKHLRDDLVASGLMGLVEAVNKMVEDGFIDDANPTGLMSLCIKHALGDTADGEAMIRIPPRTLKRKREQGIELHPPQRDFSVSAEYVDNLEMIDYEDDERPRPPVHTKSTPRDPRRIDDMRQLIDAACENDTDREIVRLREARLVDREIAERLGLPRSTLQVMRRTIYARFLQLSGLT